MADTVRSKEEVLSLLSNNLTGQITAQDLRDAVVSLYDQDPASLSGIDTLSRLDRVPVVDISQTDIHASGQIKTASILDFGTSFTTSVKSSAYTAKPGESVLVDANAAGGSFNITLPSSPNVGDSVEIIMETDDISTSPSSRDLVGVNRNGNNIDGTTQTEHLKLVKEGEWMGFKYIGGGTGWKLIDGRLPIVCEIYEDSPQSGVKNTNLQHTYSHVRYDSHGCEDVSNDRIIIARSGLYECSMTSHFDQDKSEEYQMFASITENGIDFTDRISSFVIKAAKANSFGIVSCDNFSTRNLNVGDVLRTTYYWTDIDDDDTVQRGTLLLDTKGAFDQKLRIKEVLTTN